MFGQQLRALRKQNGLSLDELAARYNAQFSGKLNKSTLSRYENDVQEPMFSVVRNLAQLFDVSCEVLTDGCVPPVSGVQIPVLGRVAAGLPISAVQEILGYEEITPQLASQGEYFALEIKGDSMEPKFSEHDIVVIRQQNDVDSGQIAIVLINGDDAVCKKVMKHRDGISLVSFNPSYSPRFFTNREIDELPIHIIGRVVELRAKF